MMSIDIPVKVQPLLDQADPDSSQNPQTYDPQFIKSSSDSDPQDV